MPRTIKVKWDTSDGDLDFTSAEDFADVALPELVILPSGIDEEDISDWLSDNWGYCHFGWSYHSDETTTEEKIHED